MRKIMTKCIAMLMGLCMILGMLPMQVHAEGAWIYYDLSDPYEKDHFTVSVNGDKLTYFKNYEVDASNPMPMNIQIKADTNLGYTVKKAEITAGGTTGEITLSRIDGTSIWEANVPVSEGSMLLKITVELSGLQIHYFQNSGGTEAIVHFADPAEATASDYAPLLSKGLTYDPTSDGKKFVGWSTGLTDTEVESVGVTYKAGDAISATGKKSGCAPYSRMLLPEIKSLRQPDSP